MAKGPLFLAPISGKVGNLVAYVLKDSNNKETQATRAYVSQVSNPRTEPQAIQRLKMAPALNFYRQLARILNNAWQGQEYGNRSRQYFMAAAMRQTQGIPFIIKGDKGFYPGQYQVASGSLGTQSVTAIATNKLAVSLVSGGISGTWGEVSQGIINKNFGIKDGDKLTFIFVGKRGNDYVPAFSYVILDTHDENAAADVLASSNLEFTGTENAALQVGITNGPSDIVAGAFILSRLNLQTETWERSNSVMFCSAAYLALQMGAAAYETAVMSYMNSGDLSSDWYLNQGISGGNQGSGGGSENVTLVSVSNINVGSGSTWRAGVALMSDGTKRALASNGTTRYVVYQSSGEYVYDTSKQATAGNLTAIQGVDPAVTGWLYVQASEDDTPTINDP